jgi:tetratricopeptide (TPR) repeat protein
VFVLRATRATGGDAIVTVNETTNDAPGLLRTVERGARALRRALGERTAVAIEPSITEVITPSFEAFQHFARGRALVNESQAVEAISELRVAISLDSAFAGAWAAFGTAHMHLAQLDSSRAAFQVALRHPERLTLRRRLDIEGKLANLAFDYPAGYEACSAILRSSPNPAEAAAAFNNRATSLDAMGRFEEAAQDYRRAIALSAVSPQTLSILNAIDLAVLLRHGAEAGSLANRLSGVRRAGFLAQAAAVRGEWAAAESLSRVAMHSWREDPGPVAGAVSILGALEARRGEVRRASETLDWFLRDLAAAKRPAVDGVRVGWTRWWVRNVGGDATFEASPAWLQGLPEGALLTYQMASGRSGAVRARVQVMLRDPGIARSSTGRAFVDELAGLLPGYEALDAGRWGEAVAILGPFARQGGTSAVPPREFLRSATRWRLAGAFERLGQPDSAAAYLDLVVRPPILPTPLLESTVLAEPFARHRLVLLYARTGKAAAARREFDRLSEIVTRPDPDRVAWLDEAREAVRAAEAMSGAARR